MRQSFASTIMDTTERGLCQVGCSRRNSLSTSPAPHPPKEILQTSKLTGHVAYVCTIELSDIILSAGTAELEDGSINDLQHRSIRSISAQLQVCIASGWPAARGRTRRVRNAPSLSEVSLSHVSDVLF